MSIVPGHDRTSSWTHFPAPAVSVWTPTIKALDSTGRTARLCIILLVLYLPTVLLLAMLKG